MNTSPSVVTSFSTTPVNWASRALSQSASALPMSPGAHGTGSRAKRKRTGGGDPSAPEAAAISDPSGGKRPLSGSRQTETTRLPPDRGARFQASPAAERPGGRGAPGRAPPARRGGRHDPPPPRVRARHTQLAFVRRVAASRLQKHRCLFRVAGAKRKSRLRPTTTTIGGGALLPFPRRDHSRYAHAV